MIAGKPDPKEKSETGNKQKYAFLIYNVSVTVYNIIRFILRPTWQKHFI